LVEEETVEDVRNVEDGTAWAWEAWAWWTPPDDAAMREEGPRKAARTSVPGRQWLERLWRIGEAHGRMSRTRKCSADGNGRNTAKASCKTVTPWRDRVT
jgi:hypothetical protein